MRHQGRLNEWNDERGFGFVTSIADESRAFVHVSAFPRELRRPRVLDLLSYEVSLDERGRLKATDVRYMTQVQHKGAKAVAPVSPRQASGPWLPISMLGLVGLMIAAVVVQDTFNKVVLASYSIMSALSLLAYGLDKHAAQAGGYRVSEQTLIMLGLLGGWPGALIAQRVFRHKTAKQSFQTMFWFSVVANVGLVATFVVLNWASGG